MEAEVEAEEAGACLQLERHELRRSAGWILVLIATDPDLASDLASEGGVRALVAYASARPGETTDLEQQEEGAWAIANLSANEAHAAHIVEAGGPQLLLTLLASPSTGVRLQAVWALANLASVPEAKQRSEPAPTLTVALAPTPNQGRHVRRGRHRRQPVQIQGPVHRAPEARQRLRDSRAPAARRLPG